MDTNIFELMTDNDIKEYLEEQEANIIISSGEYEFSDYADCCLPV